MENLLPYTGVIIGWLIALGAVGFIMFYLGAVLEEEKAAIITGVIGGVVLVVLGVPLTNTYTSSQSFQKNVKSVQTNYNPESVYREMKVVGRAGDVIYETAGSFDIDYSDNRLRWIDEDGELNLIYLGDSATVIIEEKQEAD